MDEEPRLALGQIGRDIAAAKYAIAFTGAGISTESGLPDYRGTQGLWNNKRYEELAHIDTFLENPAESWEFYRWRLDSLKEVAPNAAHIALAGLQKRGRLGPIITQNVDGLHQRAGSRNVIQLHGTIHVAECLSCRRSFHATEVEEILEASEDGVPRCFCGQPLKPGVTLFGERLNALPLEQAIAHANKADYALCLGSSLQVIPAAAIPQLVLSNGGKVAIINQGKTGYDGAEGVTKIDAPLGEALLIVLKACLDVFRETEERVGRYAWPALGEALGISGLEAKQWGLCSEAMKLEGLGQRASN